MANQVIKIKEMFERSAHGLASAGQADADPELVARGWERRFTADAQRAQEMLELYERLGYEVRAEDARSGGFPDNCCEECRSTAALEFKTIYTRKKKT